MILGTSLLSPRLRSGFPMPSRFLARPQLLTRHVPRSVGEEHLFSSLV
jgi:hypothetical protein